MCKADLTIQLTTLAVHPLEVKCLYAATVTAVGAVVYKGQQAVYELSVIMQGVPRKFTSLHRVSEVINIINHEACSQIVHWISPFW